MHLKGENDRVKEKLRLAEKSAAARQIQMDALYRQLDLLQGKGKDVPDAETPDSGRRTSTSGTRRVSTGQ
jgi:hypothetical protein